MWVIWIHYEIGWDYIKCKIMFLPMHICLTEIDFEFEMIEWEKNTVLFTWQYNFSHPFYICKNFTKGCVLILILVFVTTWFSNVLWDLSSHFQRFTDYDLRILNCQDKKFWIKEHIIHLNHTREIYARTGFEYQ